MTTYKDAGVDVAAGDKASKIAYKRASETFASRKGMIGQPVFEEGGFAGMLDMGAYYLVQTDDGTGTKIDIALHCKNCKTLGYDLLAMVADDAVCTGAEVISLSNTLDVPKVDVKLVDDLLSGLAAACKKQKIVIPAGEIAEVPGSVNGAVWSATSVGIVAKNRVLDPSTVKAGDAVIALREHGARSNGFSLIRKILKDRFGDQWEHAKRDSKTWGETVLEPSIVYHAAILSLIGRYKAPRPIKVKAIAHITGGGIPSKFRRVLRTLGAELTDLWEPPAFIEDLITLGKVSTEEAYRTWNMGNGMLVVVAEKDVAPALKLLKKTGVEAKRAGTITKNKALVLLAYDGTILKS